ncbi:MAG: NERD domain-containing protein/DEAD/DEAH box helicase [Deltaproteobacteria bacterium]
MAQPTGLWPRELPRPTSSAAERAIHAALREGIPDDWCIWHSLRAQTSRGVDAEADFVVAVPGRGMLVVEVKGGYVDVRGGVWRQSGRTMEKVPREQAHGTSQTILQQLKARGTAPPAWGVATWFPDVPVDGSLQQGDMVGRVLGRDEMADAGAALRRVIERALPRVTEPTDDAWIEALHKLWGETWIPRGSLGLRLARDDRERVQFDAAQAIVLEGLLANPRVLVSGGAGTGKTLVAREAARRLADGGSQRVALVCFSPTLSAPSRSKGSPRH